LLKSFFATIGSEDFVNDFGHRQLDILLFLSKNCRAGEKNAGENKHCAGQRQSAKRRKFELEKIYFDS
jgi:hypothetical protein